MQWRDMTAAEIATHPESRLRGALLWMVVAAAIAFAVQSIGMVLAFIVVSTGGIHANPGNIFSWLDGPYGAGTTYMIPVVFFMIWSLVFVVMTLGRFKATPIAASVGIVLWVVLRAAFAYVGQAPLVAAAEHTSLADALVRSWPFAIAVFGEATLAAGFCGYMASGRRPNAYYRRRLPTS